MTASESKKNKRRKNKKGGKSTNQSDQPVQEPEVSSTKQEMDEIQTMMDAEDDDMQVPSHIRGPRCLLCRKQKPTCSDENDVDGDISSSSLPLWVCADCRKKVEDDERRKTEQEADERKAAELFFQPEFQTRTSEPTTPNGSICTCQACTERRQIEGEHEQETKELQQCWIRLRDIVRCVYRESVTTGGGSDCDEHQVGVKDVSKVKSMVSRLCSRDPHQLYQRLESQAREYVIEMKVRLLKQLTSGHKTPPQARQFVTMLLEEYSNMCVSAKKVATFFNQLESEHLNKFKLTWAKHNKHLFQSIIYTDPLVQNSLPMLITQLRLGAASKEAYHEDSYPKLLHRYLKFDDDMSEVSVAWRDCQQLLEEYSEEQAALKAKQKMLKEDWEFFKAQRKLLEKQILKNTKKPSPVNNSQCLETQFTETMRNLLQGSKVTKDDYPEHVQCPNCNRKRCPCDECTISHMITCGIISPEVQESMSPHVPTSADMPSFGHDSAARYVIDITPPSMSSTGSSSGSSSPVPLDTEKLSLPFEDCSELDNEEAFLQQIKNDLISQRVKEEAAKYMSEQTLTTCCASSGSGDGVTDKCSCSNCQSQSMLTKVIQTEEVPCQCHNCQKGMTMPYLPPSVSPPPRPASLHLYPHIHGPNTSLHSALVPHPMPRLHPQLYELHHNPAPAPVRPKPIAHSTKKPFNLDLDSHEALHEHIYHAYGEWENPIDNPLLFSAHKFAAASGNMNNGSELLGSPPPLLSGKSFFSDSAGIPPLPKGVSQATKVAANFNLKPINRNLYPTSSQPAKSLVGSSSMPDQCSKHGSSQLNSFANMHAHTSVSASSASTASLTAKLTPDLLRAATNNKDASSLLGSGALGSLAGLNLTQACSHFNQHQLQQPPTAPSVNQPAHKLTSPSLSHTLSAAAVASTNHGLPSCHDDDCDGNQDDNCDDDSCSEQSSSTSTSNQKDGKYCDCCYCEFFGHGTPPVAPTSRNFVEMRDKLRLQLKRKKEIKSPALSMASDTMCSASMVSEGMLSEAMLSEGMLSPHGEDPMWRMGLDELVRFINGEDEKKSAKTAKKARQKQKKAQEKARKLEEEEEQQRREEELKKRAEEALRLQQLQLQQKQQESDSRNNKKRKGKQKESSAQALDVRNGDSSAGAKGQQSAMNRSITSSPDTLKKSLEPSSRSNSQHHQKQLNEQSKVSRAMPQPRQVSPRLSSQENSAQEQGRKKKSGGGKTPEDEVTCQNAKNTNLRNHCIAKTMLPENGRRLETLPLESGKKKKVNSQPIEKTKQENTSSQTGRVKNANASSSSQQNGKLRVEPRQDSPAGRQMQATTKGRVESNGTVQTPVRTTAAATTSENKENGVSPKSTDSSPQSGDSTGVPASNKSRRKKRGKGSEDIDEIFLPKQDLDLENGEMDEFEKELEEFKRFCFDSQPTPQRTKLAINVNVKDMLLKKKVPTSVGCG